MALAFMGTAPLVALAQQNTGAQAPAGSPSGTTSIDRGQDTNAIDAPGAPGQQSAGTVGTAQGQPATGGGAAPFGGTGGGGTGGTGGGAVGAGGGGAGVGAGVGGTGGTSGGAGMTGGQTGTGAAGATSGPTYRGTGNDIPDTPSGSPPVDVGTQIGPEPGERAGNAGTGTVGAGGGGTGGAGQGGGGTGGGGQAAAQQAPLSGDALQREVITLRERVARLEGQVRDLGRGTGGAGTGGGGTGGGGTTDTSNVRAQGPTVVATVTFDGTVRAVSSNRIQVVDREDGSVYNMRIDRGTRVSDDGKAINPRELTEGTPVRASLAFISGEEHARDIVVIDEETQRQQQQQQRQQRQQRLEGMGPGQRLMQPDAPPRTPGGLPGSSTR
jgi:hypothetical protein